MLLSAMLNTEDVKEKKRTTLKKKGNNNMTPFNIYKYIPQRYLVYNGRKKYK